jgi:hypothetical protein
MARSVIGYCTSVVAHQTNENNTLSSGSTAVVLLSIKWDRQHFCGRPSLRNIETEDLCSQIDMPHGENPVASLP